MGVPVVLPVIVDLPAWAGEWVFVGLAPSLNRVVRRAEAGVWTKVGRRCGRSARRGGAHDFAVLRKRSEQLDANFEPYAAIPIDGDVATAARLLRSHGIPDQAAILRHNTRELGCVRLAPDNGERNRLAPMDFDDVRRHVGRSTRFRC